MEKWTNKETELAAMIIDDRTRKDAILPDMVVPKTRQNLREMAKNKQYSKQVRLMALVDKLTELFNKIEWNIGDKERDVETKHIQALMKKLDITKIDYFQLAKAVIEDGKGGHRYLHDVFDSGD